DGSAHKLGIAPEKVVITVDRHGNTSAASIPLALCDAVADRRIKRGNLVLLEAMGGGFTWGSALVRWRGCSNHTQGGIHPHSARAPLTDSDLANIVDNSAGYVRRGQGKR